MNIPSSRDHVAALEKAIRSGRGGLLTRLDLVRALLAAGEVERALAAARDTAILAPQLSDAALLLGQALIAAGHLPAAIAEIERALRLDADYDAAKIALARAWLEAGEVERATEILAPLARGSSEEAKDAARLIADAEAMRASPRSAPGYVRHLFDQFSADYDRKMLDELSYRAPLILRELADLVTGAETRSSAILDLGCGTGLAGAAFADIAAALDGIDLSPRMLEIARARGIYRSLERADFESALAADGPRYDLILAADTLVYLGDLAPTFGGAARRLASGGFFLFTVEKSEGPGYELGPKRRYRHSEAYLREEAARAGLDMMAMLACSPRTDAGAPVPGLAVALQRV